MNQCIKKSYSEHAAVIYGNAIVVKKLYIRISGIEYIKETVL